MEQNDQSNQLFSEQKADALSQIVRAAAHDINNSLAIIVSSTELMNASLGDQANPRLNKAIGNIKSGVDRGTAMVRFLKNSAYKENSSSRIIDSSTELKTIKDFIELALRGDLNRESLVSSDLFPIFTAVDSLELALVNIAFALKEQMLIGSSIIFQAQNESDDLKIYIGEVKTGLANRKRTQMHQGPGIDRAVEQAEKLVKLFHGSLVTSELGITFRFPKSS